MSDDQDTLFASSLSSNDQASLAPTPVSSQTVTSEPNLAYYNPMDIDVVLVFTNGSLHVTVDHT